MSDLYELFDLMERDLIEAGIGAPVITKAFEAPSDDFPAPPINSDSEFPEPPVSEDENAEDTPDDDYDTSLDAANQEIEEAGNTAVADDFPEPPESEDSEMDLEEDEITEPIEEDIPEETEPETPTEDPQIEYKKKLKIHSNMNRLLAIIKSSRDSFEQKFSSKITGKQYVGYHKIINTFEDLYNVTENVLKKEFVDGTYKTLIKQYVSLVKVYDIVTKMTENFIEAYIKENSETNS